MRMLSLQECKAIAGAGTTVAAFSASSSSSNGTSMSTAVGGVTTTITCSTPLHLGFTLGATSAGKFLNLDTGATISMPANCTTVITDSVNHTELICTSGSTTCKWVNLATGASKQVSIGPDDTGMEQLAQIQGEDLSTLFAGGDWLASADTIASIGSVSSGGSDGGGEGGEGGEGGDGGDGGGDGDDVPRDEA